MVEKASTRLVTGQALAELGETHPDVVVIGGDLNKSTFSNIFGAKFPERFFDMGAAEQNIINIAAGFAASGKIPVVSTFAVFGSSRPYDQLRVGVSQPNLNVKVMLTHSGIVTGEDGVSAHSIEDIAIMCALPSFNVIVPSDAPEAAQALETAIETVGPFYIRLSRPETPVIHNNGHKFTLGKAETVREGSDATIVACGIMVYTALEAADELAKVGITCRVLNMATLKPLDEEAIIKAAQDTGAIVSAEEHYIGGGLGAMVSQVVGQNHPTPMESVALKGYAESGTSEELLAKYGLTSNDVVNAVKKAVSRKKP